MNGDKVAIIMVIIFIAVGLFTNADYSGSTLYGRVKKMFDNMERKKGKRK